MKTVADLLNPMWYHGITHSRLMHQVRNSDPKLCQVYPSMMSNLGRLIFGFWILNVYAAHAAWDVELAKALLRFA